MQKPIKRVLIANRGEIAVRIIRAAKELGIETVAIYSEPDQGALHVRQADHKISLGGASAKDTYLNQAKIINAAIQSGADAIHPGYGFFSEKAGFAQAVLQEGFSYVGPSPEVIALMGDKGQARKKAAELGVPLVPGTEAEMSLEVLAAFIERVGYPIMVKAVAGGSGRGMRLVKNEGELEPRLGEAKREALAAFGDNTVFLEKCIVQPRHIEVQIFGDSHGNVIHIGERECSVQRQHQKLIEETPAPNLHPKLREKLLAAGVKIAKAVSYCGAGTVEFLVEDGREADSHFYFLEMNTRIQVEHPVTEEATGFDLVKMQFLVAQGETLPHSQKEVQFHRHAMEFRIYGENPQAHFSPTSGTIRYLSRTGGPGVREESWVEAGTRVSSYYDSLLTKLVISGRTRTEALQRAKRVLGEYILEGLETTLGFHRWVLSTTAFQQGQVHVHWIENEYHGETQGPGIVGPLSLPPCPEFK